MPIVRFVDQRTSVECDLAVDSKDGVLNSRIIQIISQIDDRFQKLCLLVRSQGSTYAVTSFKSLHMAYHIENLIVLPNIYMFTCGGQYIY